MLETDILKAHEGEIMPWCKVKTYWLKSALKLRNANEYKDFIEALLAFTSGQDYMAKTERVEMLLEDMREFCEYTRKTYFLKLQGNSKGGKISSRKRSAEIVNEKSITENQQFSLSQLELSQVNPSQLKLYKKIEKEIKPQSQTLIPLEGQGLEAGLDKLKFLDFWQAFSIASGLEIPWEIDRQQADLVRWRCTDIAAKPELLREIGLAVLAANGNKTTLTSEITDLLRPYEISQNHKPIPRQAWKLCGLLAAIPEDKLTRKDLVEGFANEFERSNASEGESIWPSLQEKAKYIAANPITNLAAFLKTRQRK